MAAVAAAILLSFSLGIVYFSSGHENPTNAGTTARYQLTPFTSSPSPSDSNWSCSSDLLVNGYCSFSSNWYRNGSLWAALDRGYQGNWYAGVGLKVMWYRSDGGYFAQPLEVTGKWLNSPAGQTNNITSLNQFHVLYTEYHYQPTSLFFPIDGYWQVTGKIGNLTLTFIIHVLPHSACQLPGGVCYT